MAGQTRRSWMVTISRVAVGVGFSNSMPADAPDANQLPPGVYLPSADHLGHALMSAEQFHPIPPGCPTDYVRPRSGPFNPRFFSVSEFAVIHRLAELLLGEPPANVSQEMAEWVDLRVSSAGSVREAARRIDPLYRDLAVAYYGPAQVKKLETADPANICREGLVWISDAAKDQHSKDFLALDTEQQVAMLDTISDARPDKQLQNPGTRLFDFLKAEIIRGFYTSRTGLKELDFKGNAFYARSPGCDSKA